jgi:hypothetical protein
VTDDTAGTNPATPDEGLTDGLEALTEEVLPALIARLRSSRLGELEVRGDGWRVRLRRESSGAVRGRAGGPAGVGDPVEAELAGIVARSPAVGYFQPAPNLVPGRTVQAGDALGSIDVLGIVQEVTAPEAGIIAAVQAEDGQAVEFGQTLADIDPLEADGHEIESASR